MAETIQIPRTIREAKTALTGHAALLTKTEWARSAIVRGFTDDTDASMEEFAALGIVGLRNVDTIRHHRAAWQLAMDKGLVKEVQPGQTTKLPNLEFPANDTVGWGVRNEDRREALRQQAVADGVGASKVVDVASNPRAVATAMKADPEFVNRVFKNLPSATRQKAAARIYELEQEEAVAERDAQRGRPMPPRPVADFGASGTFVFVETTRKALQPLRDALYQHQVDHIQLDADHREIFLGILAQIEAAVAQLRMAADGTVTDAEIAAFLAQ